MIKRSTVSIVGGWF